ncbi:MAG: flagellar export protein FliJ [Spirochaetaceae bacterium]|nr:flagellar export protein FliJ [Spirochaetaceae bacterium]
MQKILDLREFEEKQAQIELGKAVAEVNRIQQELEVIAAERLRMVQVCNNSDVYDMITNERYIFRLDANRDKLLEELAAAQLVAEKKRTIFAEAMKNRKVLSKLKEKQFATYKRENQQIEDVVSDDLTTSRYRIIQ